VGGTSRQGLGTAVLGPSSFLLDGFVTLWYSPRVVIYRNKESTMASIAVPKKVYAYLNDLTYQFVFTDKLQEIPDGKTVYSYRVSDYKRVMRVERTLSIPRGERVPA
jgi:hypothetical protein